MPSSAITIRSSGNPVSDASRACAWCACARARARTSATAPGDGRSRARPAGDLGPRPRGDLGRLPHLLDEAARACGSRPFARAAALDRARRDLELFLLQHRLDPMLARAGEAAWTANDVALKTMSPG